MGAALALQFFLFIKIQDGRHIDSAVSKIAIKLLFLNQLSCVIYNFFQTFILYHMIKTDVSFPPNLK